MNVLLLTNSFPPDSGIASVRPCMFAKYLSAAGHRVTVIRSGNIYYQHPNIENLEGLDDVRILSYEGKDADAERYQRGEWAAKGKEKMLSNVSYGGKLLALLKNVIRPISRKIIMIKKVYYDDGYVIYKKICCCAHTSLKDEKFDCIISTFSPLGCIMAGNKLKKLFQSKWVIDFRDLMDNQLFIHLIRSINHSLQNYYIKNADACFCVSNGNAKRLAVDNYNKKIYTIYNGFDAKDTQKVEKDHIHDASLSICYTGTMYGDMRDARPMFRMIKDLSKNGCIDCNHLKVNYVGSDGMLFRKQAKEYGLEEIVCDFGYLSRLETIKVQNDSDLFLVLSWNTQLDQGILTGKFYEALINQKPIVAFVSGTLPNSELAEIMKDYQLGACYEEAADKETYPVMKEYLEKQYQQKVQGKMCFYSPDKTAYQKFSYYSIVQQVERCLIGLVDEQSYNRISYSKRNGES